MKFKIYQDQAGLYRWTLVSNNGKIMADGSEGYSKRSNCVRALKKLVETVRWYGYEMLADL